MQSKIKVMGDFTRVNDEEREFINKRLEKFEEKHQQNFSEMHLKLDCHIHKETSRGRPAYMCKLSLDSDKGNFNAEEQNFGAEKTIARALDKIEKQITRQKGK